MKKTKKPVNRKRKLESILSKSNNIQLLSKNGSTIWCKCGICNNDFKVVGYMNIYKFVCPICRKHELAERKKEKRNQNLQSEFTAIKRKCDYLSYCLSTKKYLCNECLIKTVPYYSKKEFADIVNNANKSITIIGDYIDSKTPIEYKCNICGNTYFAKPYNLLKGISGCKNCHQSNGERIISLYLLKHGIRYEIEKKFDDCKYKYPLRFDFYLPDINVVIEYDGKQHFEPIQFSINQNAEDVYKKTKVRDKIKDEYCIKNKIKLIRIKYTDLDIDNTLNCELQPILKEN
ncbi:MAG: hypothetical protein SPE24_08905 [Erysipelotrichaceae bacterium]|nr:hypothetical protein [Erysipelotrichaceae bacterium]